MKIGRLLLLGNVMVSRMRWNPEWTDIKCRDGAFNAILRFQKSNDDLKLLDHISKRDFKVMALTDFGPTIEVDGKEYSRVRDMN
jgi:hypothetical protein